KAVTAQAVIRVAGDPAGETVAGRESALVGTVLEPVEEAGLYGVLSDDLGHVVENRVSFRGRGHVDPPLGPERHGAATGPANGELRQREERADGTLCLHQLFLDVGLIGNRVRIGMPRVGGHVLPAEA